MALWYCPTCTAAYAVGLARCPQCGADDHLDNADDLAPTTQARSAGEPPQEPPVAAAQEASEVDAAG